MITGTIQPNSYMYHTTLNEETVLKGSGAGIYFMYTFSSQNGVVMFIRKCHAEN